MGIMLIDDSQATINCPYGTDVSGAFPFPALKCRVIIKHPSGIFAEERAEKNQVSRISKSENPGFNRQRAGRRVRELLCALCVSVANITFQPLTAPAVIPIIRLLAAV